LDIEWRTVQLFLGSEGISEVALATHDTRKARCTCTAFSNSGRCKHIKFVKERLIEGDGNYNIQIPEDVPDEEAAEAMASLEDWREFVMKYGKIETID